MSLTKPTPPKRAHFENPVSDEDKDVMIYAAPGPKYQVKVDMSKVEIVNER